MNYSAALVGQRLLSVEKRDYSWFFSLSEDVRVGTESPWRLLSQGRIIVTSEDDGHPFGLPEPVDAASRVLATVSNRTVESAEIDASTGDLTANFGGSTCLQFLQMSCGYESWRLYAQGNETICMGAGEIAHFVKR